MTTNKWLKINDNTYSFEELLLDENELDSKLMEIRSITEPATQIKFEIVTTYEGGTEEYYTLVNKDKLEKSRLIKGSSAVGLIFAIPIALILTATLIFASAFSHSDPTIWPLMILIWGVVFAIFSMANSKNKTEEDFICKYTLILVNKLINNKIEPLELRLKPIELVPEQIKKSDTYAIQIDGNLLEVDRIQIKETQDDYQAVYNTLTSGLSKINEDFHRVEIDKYNEALLSKSVRPKDTSSSKSEPSFANNFLTFLTLIIILPVILLFIVATGLIGFFISIITIIAYIFYKTTTDTNKLAKSKEDFKPYRVILIETMKEDGSTFKEFFKVILD